MENLLDHQWIGNLLNISFTLVIFILGIPLVFSQTFVPEQLRQFETTNQIRDKKLLELSVLFLLYFILLFGNNGIKFCIEEYFKDMKGEISLERGGIFLISYYLISLTFFILFCYKTYITFKIIVFDKTNIYEQVLKDFFQKRFSNYESITIEKNLLDLKKLSIVYSNNEYRYLFLEGVCDLILEKLKFINKSDVSVLSQIDSAINQVFDEVVFSILKLNTIDESEIKKFRRKLNQIIQELALIEAKTKNESAIKLGLRESHIPELIYSLINQGILNLDKERITYSIELIARLRELNTTQETMFKLIYCYFTNKIYHVVSTELKYIEVNFNTYSVEDQPLVKFNSLAYISLYYHQDNAILKNKAKKTLKSFVNNNIIKLDDLEDAIIHFENDSKYDTANTIYLLNKDAKKRNFL